MGVSVSEITSRCSGEQGLLASFVVNGSPLNLVVSPQILDRKIFANLLVDGVIAHQKLHPYSHTRYPDGVET